MSSKQTKITLFTATALVIANMIGTGVFTSLGFTLYDLTSPFTILLLWVVGGLVALCGALCYGELGAALPRSGSEYHYLSKLIHPSVGFLSGFVSVTVGFAAPVALAAMALGGYASRVFPQLNEIGIALAVITLLTGVHASSVRLGSGVQNIFTTLKVLLILVIVIAGFFIAEPQAISLVPDQKSWDEILSSGFAVSLYWVFYSYSGWNASAYIAGELDQPQKNLPRSLFRGTLFVMILYLLINFIFLYTTPAADMLGQKEVAFVAAGSIFGMEGGRVIGLIISILLVSTVSSMVLVGPRVAQVMGEDLGLMRFLSIKNKNGVPWIAVILQSIISITLVLTASFEKVLNYVGFTLNIFLFLTVFSLFALRIRHPELPRPYKTWGYPVTPILFLGVTGWVLFKGFELKPIESLYGLGTIGIGLVIYFIDYLSRVKKK